MGLDRITLQFSTHEVQELDLNKQGFKTVEEKTNNGMCTKKIHTAKGIKQGFTSIQVNEITNTVTSVTSGKILRDQYYEGLTFENFELFAKEYNNTGIIKVKPEVLFQAKLRTLEDANNIEANNKQECIDTILNFGSANTGYTLTKYNKNYKKGYAAKRNIQRNEYQIGYDKARQLKKYPVSLESQKGYTDNTLRIESSVTSFADIRKRFKTEDNRLGLVLQSKETPNTDLFNKIISKGFDMELLRQETMELSFDEIIKEIGWRGLFEQNGNDFKRVELFIKSKYPNHNRTNRTARRKIKAAIEYYNKINRIKTSTTNSVIREIQEKLKAAV